MLSHLFVVGDDFAHHDPVAAALEQALDDVAGRVIAGRARGRERDDGEARVLRRLLPVLLDRVGEILIRHDNIHSRSILTIVGGLGAAEWRESATAEPSLASENGSEP